MKLSLMTIFCALISINALAAGAYGPVQVGGSDEFDACGGVGIVLSTTTLFTTDKDGAIQFETVSVNQTAHVCDEDSQEDLIGIVFGPAGADCQVGSPITKRAPYQGPCKSGWIKKSFFHQLAG
jgi:hypothetical protein